MPVAEDSRKVQAIAIALDKAVVKAPPLDPRNVSWSKEDLVPRDCPICGSGDYRPLVIRPDDLLVSTCNACGMHYLPWIPSEQQLADFYSTYCQTHQSRGSLEDGAAAIRSAQRRRGGNELLNEIGKRRRLRGCKLIELGCSTGPFLLDAHNVGAIVSGMEADALAREFVTSKLGISCHGNVRAALNSGPYDVVVALNLIEHLPEPKTWLVQICKALAAGGLLVLWTPNGGQADTLGAGWVGFRVDLDHLNYFSTKSLATLLVSVGLWPEAVWEFKQADLSGFRTLDTFRSEGRTHRLLRRFMRPPSASWTLPSIGGRYTLCIFAGKV